ARPPRFDVAAVDTLGDVGRLGVGEHEDLHVVGPEVVVVDVAQITYGPAGDVLEVGPVSRVQLAGHHRSTGGHECLAGDSAERIVGQDVVEDSIADGVGHL